MQFRKTILRAANILLVFGENMISKEELLSYWGDTPARVHTIYLPLPLTKYPPDLPLGFGETPPEEVFVREAGREFIVYETQHPELKGQMTTWKVLRVEVYPGTDECAYDAMVVCHCDRLENLRKI